MTTEKNLDELAPLGNEWEKSQPGTGICGKCVLCLLLNAVFVLALFLAFLIGHFASEAHLPLNNKTASTLQNQTEIKQKYLEFEKNIERTRQTIKDVYPPQLYDSESFFDSQSDQDFALLSPFNNDVHHSNTKLISRSDYPLVPLPRIALPRHYNVDLDLTEFYGVVDWPRIRGNLSILLEAFGNATDDELLFNAGTNIFIQRIRLYRQTEFGKVVVEIKSVKRHIEREFVRLILGKRLSVGWYWLYIEFNTRICQSELEGTHCFPGPLLSSDPKESSSSLPSRQLATGFSTKFEPNFARTFFPGWDDPSIRSTFNLSVQHFSDTNILFNTSPLPNKQNVSTSNLIKLTRFETTPPMPLYLFAIATGPFKPIQVVTTKTNLSLNIWSNNQDLLTAHFVANFSPIMFDKLQEDFNVKYPLSKLDIFITPKYPVGGMENWGLIILHSDNVRISNSDSTLPINDDFIDSSKEEKIKEQKNIQRQNLIEIDKLAERYKIEKLITHELIHQWFGNLVSIWNWEELWLSEGFTSYFVFDFLNAHNHPQLTEHEYYLKLIELINQQSTDGRSSLIKLITNSKQLDRLFDSIQLYTKGAVVVKMLKDLVGPEVFRTSIARFLRENSFQSVDRRSLWTAFPTNADHGADTIRLKDVMETWLLNKGIPEVEVKRNYEDKSIKLEQQQADKNRHLIYLDDDKMGRMRLNKRFKRMWQMEEEEEEDEIKKDEDINGILHWMLDGLEENNTASTATSTTTTSTTKEIKRRKETNIKNVHLTTKKRQLRAERKKLPKYNLWSIPFSYSFGSVKSKNGQILRQFWLINETIRFVDIGLNKDQYLLANPHWVYSYRVNYDILNWRMIITQVI
uniref:Aminopeptidase n=1 Tax=Meloidogyne incognita TaxID=6306 RepID=A0A914N2W9_MELIC